MMTKASTAWLEVLSELGGEDDLPYGQRHVDYLIGIVAAIRVEWVRLFAKVEIMADAGAAPSSQEAFALIVRIRELSAVTRGHLSVAERESRRKQWKHDRTPLPGVTLSEHGMEFLLRAGARTSELVKTV